MPHKPTYEDLLNKIAKLETELARSKKIEEASRNSADRFAQMIDILPDATFAIDTTGRVIAWNQAMETLSGVKANDIIGKGNYEYAVPFYHTRRPILIDLVLNWDDEIAQTYVYVKHVGNMLISETSNPPFRDAPSHFLNSARPLLDESGNMIGAIEVVRDISAIHQAHEDLKTREQLLKIYAERTPAPVAMFDLNMCYLAFSRRWVTDYHRSDQDLIGRCHYDVFPEIPRVWKQEHQRVLSGETIHVDAELFRFADGREEWIRRELVPWYDAQGEIGGIIIFNELITERKRAEAALEKAHLIINASPAVAFLWQNQKGWPVEFVTENVAKLFGYSEDDFVSGRICYRDIVHPEDLERVGQEVASNSAEPTCTEFVHQPYRIVTQQGDIRWVEDKTTIRRDDAGQVTHYHGIVEDVTARIITQGALKTVERQQSAILENIPDIAWLKDRHSRFIAVNEPFGKACGNNPDDLVGKNDLDIWPRKLAERYRADDVEVMQSGQRKRVEEPLADASGHQKWIETIKTPIFDENGAVIGTAGIARDITERRRMEKALRESEERYRNFVEHSFEGIWLLAFDEPISTQLAPEEQVRRIQRQGYIAECNDAFARYYGHTLRTDIIGKRLLELYDDPPSEQNFKSTLEFVQSDYRGHDRETQEVTIKGEPLYFLNNAVGIIEKDHLVGIWGTQRDITEQKRATSALSAEKERLAVTLRSIGDAVIATDRQGQIVLMNPIAEALTGWSETEAIEQPLQKVFRIVNEYSRQPCENPVQQVIKKGAVVGLASDTILISRDGSEYVIADSGAPIRDADGQIIGVVMVFRDATEARLIETELLKIEKLESLGVLAGGIAHDFNNFLTGIIGNISLAKLDLSPGERILTQLNDMEKAAMRAQELTQQLLTFSKGGEPIRRPTNITRLVTESAQFALRGANVRCEFAFASDQLAAEVDEGQITQVIHNLILNGVQAMPEGGIIRVMGEKIELAANNVLSLPAGEYLNLSIQDHGTGIKSEHLKYVFDPYFSTKQKGSGLGLAVVYSVIDKHNGRITVDSELGKGTTFRIYLPAIPEAAIQMKTGVTLIASGSGRILVMDDEDYIRILAQKMLEKMGYTATTVKDGDEAVNVYRDAYESGRPFDAVILDLTVPGGMGGKETIKQLLAIDPNIRAIVSSGYSNDPVMSNFDQYGFQAAIKKPYLIQQLSDSLRTILSERGRRS